MKWHRTLQQTARKIADDHGLDGVKIEQGGKHLKVALRYGEQVRVVTVSSTPSDTNTIHAVRRDLKHTARALLPQAPAIVPSTQCADVVPLAPVDVIEIENVPAVPALPDVLFHHTTSARLPYIILDGEIEPNNEGVLFATASPDGDRCSLAQRQADGYRQGVLLRTRIAMPGELFRPWREVLTPSEIAMHEQWARDRGQSTEGWYARREPVSLDDCYAVHARSYKTHRWVELGATDMSEANVAAIEIAEGSKCGLPPGIYVAVHFGGRFFLSNMTEEDDGGTKYVTAVIEEEHFLKGLKPRDPAPKLAIAI
jgi:hypothetical protein